MLFERATRGRSMKGFTRNYIRVELPAATANPQLDNIICDVLLESLSPILSPRGEGSRDLVVRGSIIPEVK